jgi:CsoR family transcriptional regulator, copper-sensing transcriptional repressor
MSTQKSSTDAVHSDHSRELNSLKKLGGQIEGIEKMIIERRYCADILAQIRAVRAGCLSIEASVLETHLKDCVAEAIRQKKQNVADKKIEEIVQLFRQSGSKGVHL